MIQGWKREGFDYSKRFELLMQSGVGSPLAHSFLGLAESHGIDPKEAKGLIGHIREWKDQGKDEPAQFALLAKEGFNSAAARFLLAEADRN